MRSLRRTVQTAAVLAFASSAATGCFKATLADARFKPGEQHDVWVDQYVFGLVGSPELDARQFCGAEAARVGVFENAWSFGVTLLSLGIYTPRVATIRVLRSPTVRTHREAFAMKGAVLVAAALAAFSCSACAETVLRTGLPAGEVAEGYDTRWHDAFFFGTLEPGRPEQLDKICPLGWSEVRIVASFPAALVQWTTLGIYTPSNVTVVCASPDSVYVGAPGETPLPPLCR